MICFVRHGFLTALGTALVHDCRPSASRRADNHDLGLFRGLSKIHIALSNHVIVIFFIEFTFAFKLTQYIRTGA